MKEIKGHPSVEGHRTQRDPVKITVCAECESLRSVLFMSGDRWYCTKCRKMGDARPTQIPLSNPRKRNG